uniref:Uncharacterized protein n=1 Tax=Rhizophora mucronata TaxID=61149 RepID=A0A2P2L1X6_RHIMU
MTSCRQHGRRSSPSSCPTTTPSPPGGGAPPRPPSLTQKTPQAKPKTLRFVNSRTTKKCESFCCFYRNSNFPDPSITSRCKSATDLIVTVEIKLILSVNSSGNRSRLVWNRRRA